MRSSISDRFPRLMLGLLSGLLLGVVSPTWSQEAQQHVFLPPAVAGTPESFQIHERAVYLAACGDMAESMAIARKIQAEAVALELDNSVKFVEAYWKRKAIWKENYGKDHPTEIQRTEEIRKQWEHLIKDLPDWFTKSDVTGQLNCLLGKMSSPAMAVQYLSTKQLNDPRLQIALTERDINQLWTTDGGRGAKFVFRIANPRPIETRWPPALRAPEFKKFREEFEAAREAMIEEFRQDKGPLSYECGDRLMKADDGLLTTLEEVYPRDRRKAVTDFLDYHDAKSFLQSLVLGVLRARKGADHSLFQEGHGFHGKTVLELLQYMYENGLLFAKNPEGGEGTYKKLFDGMRNIYVILSQDEAAGEPEKHKPAVEGPAWR